MTLTDEMFGLIEAFEQAGVAYALCGGLAMAVLGHARATQDVDMLLAADDMENAKQAARARGFTVEAGWMAFEGGNLRIFRLTKIDPEHHDVIPLDLITVTPCLAEVWASRAPVDTERGCIWTVSRKGLIKMKQMAGRKQDLADIEKLERENAGD